MFTIKTPLTVSSDRTKADAKLDNDQFATLEEAIHATLKAKLDRHSTMIEVDGVLASVNDWVLVHVAGGDVGIG